VGVGIRAAHRSALVLEDLHVPILLLRLGQVGNGGVGRQCGRRSHCGQRRLGRQMGRVDLGPCVNDRDDLGWRQVCQGEVMGRGKGQNIAFARYRFRLEKE
jgi:hypothetical protein